MAKNLQSKLKPTDKVSIFDVNPTAVEGLSAEMKAASSGAAVEIAASAHDASKTAVSFVNKCWCFPLLHFCSLMPKGSSLLSPAMIGIELGLERCTAFMISLITIGASNLVK